MNSDPISKEKTEKRCCIDLGSSYFRSLVVTLAAGLDGTHPLDAVQERIYTGWGEDVACFGAISEEAGERAAGIFKELSGRAAESGASRITAVATNALRAASNRKVIKDLLEKRAGSRVDILSARGEAFLGFAGATSELPPGSRAIVCDPGGTSTEISWGKAPLASGWTSLQSSFL